MTDASQTVGNRVGLHAIACAVTGAIFVGLTGEAVIGTLIWTLGTALHLPFALVTATEGLTLVAAIAGSALLARHALKLETGRASGDLR